MEDQRIALTIPTELLCYGSFILTRRDSESDVLNRSLPSPIADLIEGASKKQTLVARRVGRELLDYSDEHLVLRCTISIDGEKSPIRVVCKVGLKNAIERIAKEAETYKRHLGPVLRKCAPDYYGYYEGVDKKERRVCCLLLQDCGNPLGTSFGYAPWEFR